MSLSGTGVIAIWHDVQADFRRDFLEWHNREHMPERLAIPGFRRGRRYRAIDGGPEYFNLYETDDPAVLSSPAYLARLNAPTPWTQRVLPGFRNVARSLCRVVFTAGVGQGGVMLTLRFDPAGLDLDRLTGELAGRVLPEVTQAEGVTGAHLCRADEAASSRPTAEARMRGTPTRVPTWIVLIEGIGPAAVVAGGGRVAAALAGATPAVGLDTASYQLENSCLPAPAS